MSTTKYGPKVEAILARKPELAAAWERGRALAVLANYADLLALACARGLRPSEEFRQAAHQSGLSPEQAAFVWRQAQSAGQA